MSTISKLLDKAVSGERLTPAEGLTLLESHDLTALGQAAHAVTQRLHPKIIVRTTLIATSITPMFALRSVTFVPSIVSRNMPKVIHSRAMCC